MRTSKTVYGKRIFLEIMYTPIEISISVSTERVEKINVVCIRRVW